MIGTTWRASERVFDVAVERDVAVPVGDDVDLVGDCVRPETDDPVPAILSVSPYNVEYQSARITPRRSTSQNAWIEAGDPYFFARRGYAHAVLNVRGTGKSGGRFRNLGPREVSDVVEAVGWLADRPWCDGAVGMFGISYIGMIQPFVAERRPDALGALFCPWAATDLYRDWYYHGGVFHHGMTYKWSQQLDNVRPYPWSRENLDADEFDARLNSALDDAELRAVPAYVEALEAPDDGVNPYLVDAAINRLDEPGGYWAERRLDYEHTGVPAYHGADWGHTHIHLGAGFRNFVNWDGPAKLLVGPPEFVDRPFTQLGYEALRWFDHWLKDNDTGLLDGPPIRLFMRGPGTWREARSWPLPETRWTPFYCHPDGALSEADHLPGDGFSTYEDSPFGRGELVFRSPRLVERTAIVGPVVCDLYASTTADEVLFFVEVFAEDAAGEASGLTEGWLRGSHRRVDPDRSTPWRVYRPHDAAEPVEPGAVERYRIDVLPVGAVLEPGERVGLRITSADVEDVGEVDIAHGRIRETFARGRHLSRQSPSRVTVYHGDSRPSSLVLPVVEGNVMGTYRSGGGPVAFDERAPYGLIQMDERRAG